MSFVQDDTPDKNDRLLMFSMLGVVLMTLLAFGIAHFSKGTAAAAAPVGPAVSRDGPATVVEQAPKLDATHEEPTSSAPVSATPGVAPASPAPIHKNTVSGRSVKNPKLQIWREMTAEN